MSLDVMKQALAALETVTVDVKTTPNAYEAQRQAITALRAAIEQAQPEQNRAKKMRDAGYTRRPTLREFPREDAQPDKAPRQWQGLTDEEIWQCNAAPHESAVEYHICMAHQNVLDFAEAIEAKLKEKNT